MIARLIPCVLVWCLAACGASKPHDPLSDPAIRAEAARIQEEMKNPKVPDVPADRAVRGDRKAPVLVVVYSDFQCPYCRKGNRTLEKLRTKYAEKVAWMFKHLPLSKHKYSDLAARYYEAIAMQSPDFAHKFHDEVFLHQGTLASYGQRYLDKAAEKLGVDKERLRVDVASASVKERLAADRAEATKFNLHTVPSFVVGGITLRGMYPASVFEMIIEKRLAEKKP